jgi:hypothetical protein
MADVKPGWRYNQRALKWQYADPKSAQLFMPETGSNENVLLNALALPTVDQGFSRSPKASGVLDFSNIRSALQKATPLALSLFDPENWLLPGTSNPDSVLNRMANPNQEDWVRSAKEIGRLAAIGPVDYGKEKFVDWFDSKTKDSPILAALMRGYNEGQSTEPDLTVSVGDAIAPPQTIPAVQDIQVPTQSQSGVTIQNQIGGLSPVGDTVYGSGTTPSASAPSGVSGQDFGLERPAPLPRPDWSRSRQLIDALPLVEPEVTSKQDRVLAILGAMAGGSLNGEAAGAVLAGAGAGAVAGNQAVNAADTAERRRYENEIRELIKTQYQQEATEISTALGLDKSDAAALNDYFQNRATLRMNAWKTQGDWAMDRARIGASLQAARIGAAARGASPIRGTVDLGPGIGQLPAQYALQIPSVQAAYMALTGAMPNSHQVMDILDQGMNAAIATSTTARANTINNPKWAEQRKDLASGALRVWFGSGLQGDASNPIAVKVMQGQPLSGQEYNQAVSELTSILAPGLVDFGK